MIWLLMTCVVSSRPKLGTGPFFKFKNRRDTYSGLDVSIYVIKSPIQLVRQFL
jgi:hypothetical protein